MNRFQNQKVFTKLSNVSTQILMVAFMDKLKLTSKQIKEFAESHDIGNDVFINLKTKEIIELPNILNGPSLEFSEFHTDDLEKVDENLVDIEKIECPTSGESFEIMASFVVELPEQSLKRTLAEALNQANPFRKFNQIIHNSELRENWFKHKSNMLEQRVIDIVKEINIINT